MTETDQERQKRYVRTQLETIWKRYQGVIRMEDHELVVIAVPTYPANIEAVSALDLSDVSDLLATFSEHRKGNPNVDVVHTIEPAPAAAQNAPERSVIADFLRRGPVTRAGNPEQVGQGDDGRGPPQERADAPAKPDESLLAGPAGMELVDIDGMPSCGQENDYRMDRLLESNYRAGMKAGWNFGVVNDEAGYAKAVAAHSWRADEAGETRTINEEASDESYPLG